MKRYEIWLPVKQTWVHEVFAKNEAEALKKYRAGKSDEIYSLGGWRVANGEEINEQDPQITIVEAKGQ